MKVLKAAAVTLMYLGSWAAFAQGHSDMDGMANMGSDKQVQQVHHATGVVKAVDRASGTVTLAHEPIASLKWPAMTMGFKVQDKALLSKLTVGQKVQVDITQRGNDYVVTAAK